MTQTSASLSAPLDVPALRYGACLALGFVLGLALSLTALVV